MPLPRELDKPAQTFGPQKGIDWSRYRGIGVPLAVLAGIGLVVLSGIGLDNWLLLRGSPSQTMRRVYQRLYRWGVQVGITVPVAVTPYEFESLLQDQIPRLGRDTHQKRRLTSGLLPLPKLIGYHIQDRYQPISLTINDENKIVSLWKRLRKTLWLSKALFIRRKITRRLLDNSLVQWIKEIWSKL